MKGKLSEKSRDFPKKLKILRTERNWSQEQFARKIGVSSQRISKYERGLISPTMEVITKMAETLETSLDYLLLNDTGDAKSKIKNRVLREKLDEIDSLPVKDQDILIDILDAYIKRSRFESLVRSSS